METGWPLFEDSVGAQLLTAVLTSSTLIKERHDSLEFLNHVYLRHHVRVVVAVDRLVGSTSRGSGYQDVGPGGAPSTSLRTWHGRVVLPLTALDRHGRATTHVTNESGDLVPLFTSHDLNILFGGGLVSFASRVLAKPAPAGLAAHLRQVPWKASNQLRPAGMDPRPPPTPLSSRRTASCSPSPRVPRCSGRSRSTMR